ncbi:MAG: ketopantoate reductase family protein [Verrucomicrobia bacterium]|nr:ketopantoate reductase family protein [Verrucomicrobiota bacterium]
MHNQETIYILGSGAVGFPLAAYLTNAGRTVVAVRTSRSDVPKSTINVTVQDGTNRVIAPIETISLSNLTSLDGTLVVTTKSYTNQAIALLLKQRKASGPLVIMQNGVGVERPFLDAGFGAVCRCVLYVTSQPTSEFQFSFRPITASPIGVIAGPEGELAKCVEQLHTDGFPFRAETNIQKEIWKKAIINSVFNSICPLLDVDNGVFVRDEATANLARQLVKECITLTDRLNIGLSESEVMQQIMRISTESKQVISTLQDIRNGRQTEIDSLNLEIARLAASLQPPLYLPQTELLGKIILAKSVLHRKTMV